MNNHVLSLDILIPVYNEAENIIKVLKSLDDSLSFSLKKISRILICYDYDEDTTLDVVRNIKMEIPILLVKNQGKGPHDAIMEGFRQEGSDCVVVFPADDFYNASIINQMYALFKEGHEVVTASRFIPGGCMKGCPPLKSLLVRLASFTLFWFTSIPVHDASNGFRLFSKKLLSTVIIESTKGFTFSLELLVKCHRLKWKVTEVPATWYERENGTSRFRVLHWVPFYLRWYFYAFVTTWLFRSPQFVKRRNAINV